MLYLVPGCCLGSVKTGSTIIRYNAGISFLATRPKPLPGMLLTSQSTSSSPQVKWHQFLWPCPFPPRGQSTS